MRKLKTLIMIGGMILGLANLSACSLNNKQSSVTKEESSSMKENNKELNEWQKEFLEGQGLPTEYSELNLTQRLSVEAIYEMMMYLENKYGIGFEYNGYVRPQILEQEHMYAYPKGGDKETDTFTVTREDDGTLTDDYPNIVVRPYYEKMITDYVEDYFGSDKVKVFSTVTETSIDDLNNISEDVIKGNVYGNNTIFIDNGICSKEEFNTFVSKFGEWSKENAWWNLSDIILLNVEKPITEIIRENYNTYLGKRQYNLRLHCYITSDGKIEIY